MIDCRIARVVIANGAENTGAAGGGEMGAPPPRSGTAVMGVGGFGCVLFLDRFLLVRLSCIDAIVRVRGRGRCLRSGGGCVLARRESSASQKLGRGRPGGRFRRLRDL